MRYQKGNGAREIEKALKILQEYETAKSQYEISEGERQRIQGRGAGWTEQKDKIANDVRKKKQILDNNLLSQILLYASKHKKQKRSFVIISSLIIDHNVFPKKLSWAPTFQEAFDIVEMDELERELK